MRALEAPVRLDEYQELAESGSLGRLEIEKRGDSRKPPLFKTD